ncbi:MAG: hypothetical protein E7589_05115 [Ruminococcaceae bacterium]|nr:hypothetical protein [Oscillospiraceae bacterium]
MKGIASLTKVLCLLLAIAMLVPALVACDNGDGNETTDNTSTTGTESTTDAATTVDPDEMHDLPADLNYGGAEVTMLTAWVDMHEDEFYLEDDYAPTGELVPDAVYHRNYAVEKQLNIDLVTLTRDRNEYLNSTHMTDHQSGLGEYQIIADSTTNKGVMIIDGYYHDLGNFEYLDLSKKYWSQGFGEVVTFGEENKQYLATGAIAVSLYRMMFATIYNQKDLNTYGLEDPYQKVMDGEWTLDAQKAMIANTFAERDNDGKPSDGDYYGLLTGVSTCMDPYLVSSKVELIKKDKDDYTWYYDTDELPYLVDVAEKVQALTSDDNTYCFEKEADHPAKNDIILKFAEREGMMATFLFYALEKSIGEINFDYGIAPIPKYSTDQDEYYTYVQDMATSVGVSSVVNDEKAMERIGATLEALGYYSSIYIEEAYFKKSMSLKFLKDPRSQDIINLLYDSVAIDFCGMMSSAIESFKLRDQLRPVLGSVSQETVVTLLNKNQTALNRNLKTINRKAAKLP